MTTSSRRLFILDLRTLQNAEDVSGIDRLVASFARSARRHAMHSDAIEIVGLIDRARPNLDPNMRNHLDGVRYNGYLLTSPPSVFVQFAPTANDPLTVGRILNSTEVFKVAVIDIVAHLEVPDDSFRRLPDRIEDRTQLCWLARYDHFYPMTQHAADRIAATLDIGPERMTLVPDARTAGVSIDDMCRTFWRDLEARATACPTAPMIGGARAKIAVLASLSSDRSDANVTTNTIFAEMGKLAELHAFSPTAESMVPVGATSTNPLSEFPFLSRRFDRIVAITGRDWPQQGIVDLLMRYGGACIQHEVPSPQSYLRWKGEARTSDIAEVELERTLGPGELERWQTDDTTSDATFLGELAAQASPLCVHSKVTARIVHDRFDVEATYLPLAGQQPWNEKSWREGSWEDVVRNKGIRAAALTRLGFYSDVILLAAFGRLSPSSAPEDSIWALSMLHDWGLRAILCFVGDMAMDLAGLRALSESVGLGNHVRFVSAAPSEQIYRDFLSAADLAVQLRAGQFAGPTVALIDCIGAGIPSVVTQSSKASIDAPSYVSAIQNELSPVLIAEALANEFDTQTSASQRAQERTVFRTIHNRRAYATRLAGALSLDQALGHVRDWS